jgi:hypothetical protein
VVRIFNGGCATTKNPDRTTTPQKLTIKRVGESVMQYLLKYLTSAPVIATLALVVLATVFIELNYLFPGLQYGTYFHSVP